MKKVRIERLSATWQYKKALAMHVVIEKWMEDNQSPSYLKTKEDTIQSIIKLIDAGFMRMVSKDDDTSPVDIVRVPIEELIENKITTLEDLEAAKQWAEEHLLNGQKINLNGL